MFLDSVTQFKSQDLDLGVLKLIFAPPQIPVYQSYTDFGCRVNCIEP